MLKIIIGLIIITSTNFTEQPLSNSSDTRIISLLERCQTLLPWLSKDGSKADQARDIYAQSCADIIDSIAISKGLDIFYFGHGNFLARSGNYQEALKYLTMAYQLKPNSFEVNEELAKNFINLGEGQTALDLINFYKHNFPETITPAIDNKLNQLELRATNGIKTAFSY